MTAQGWHQRKGDTMCFQQCDFNLPQVGNHLANHIDVLKITNGKTLNVNALLHAPTKETQIMNNAENNLQEADVKMTKPKRTKKSRKRNRTIRKRMDYHKHKGR